MLEPWHHLFFVRTRSADERGTCIIELMQVGWACIKTADVGGSANHVGQHRTVGCTDDASSVLGKGCTIPHEQSDQGHGVGRGKYYAVWLEHGLKDTKEWNRPGVTNQQKNDVTNSNVTVLPPSPGGVAGGYDALLRVQLKDAGSTPAHARFLFQSAAREKHAITD